MFLVTLGFVALFILISHDVWKVENTESFTVISRMGWIVLAVFLAEGVNILALVGCALEYFAWKRSLPKLSKTINDFDNGNFQENKVDTDVSENFPV